MTDKTNNTIKQIGLLGAIFAVVLVLIILLPNSQFLFDKREKEIRIDIKLEGIHSIVANAGQGPKKLNYEDHQETVNRFISTIEGEYRYVRLLRIKKKNSGGGPHAVGFYYQDCKYVLRYTDEYLAVPTSRKGYYYLYEKKGIAPLFDEFEAYLNKYGQLNKYGP